MRLVAHSLPHRSAWWLLLAVVAPGRLAAQQGPQPEYRVKAAYLLNFTRYVEWPAAAFPTPETPVRVCVLGEDPFESTLDETFDGRLTRGRRFELRRMDAPAQARDCHVVFVSEAEWSRHPEVLAALRRAGVLTVGEGSRFAEAGGVLSFVRDGPTVRFAVNRGAARDAELQISSRMLALAAEFHGRDPEAGPR